MPAAVKLGIIDHILHKDNLPDASIGKTDRHLHIAVLRLHCSKSQLLHLDHTAAREFWSLQHLANSLYSITEIAISRQHTRAPYQIYHA